MVGPRNERPLATAPRSPPLKRRGGTGAAPLTPTAPAPPPAARPRPHAAHDRRGPSRPPRAWPSRRRPDCSRRPSSDLASLRRDFERLGEAGLFGLDVDHAFERDHEHVLAHALPASRRPGARQRNGSPESRAQPVDRRGIAFDDTPAATRWACSSEGFELGARARCRVRSWRLRIAEVSADQPLDLGLRRRIDARLGLRPLRHDQLVRPRRPARSTAPR